VSGVVRGLIHQRCNILIGFFETHRHLYKNLGPYLGLTDWSTGELEK
jgi:hypothetical protein